jgi:hypothetical protein
MTLLLWRQIMFARITRFEMDVARRDEAMRISDTQISPGLQREPGFKQMYALIDPDTGEGLVITLWETKGDEVASRSRVGHYFGMLGPMLTALPEPGPVYDVVGSA